MGIHGIYKEIGPGQRIALSKVAVEHFEKTGRPIRVAIDISIWLFQIQSSKGGTNPALRTFYYRLLRLLSLSIHPLFVFDGPNRPPFKRNKRTGPNVASIPEFLAKQLLKQFGLPFHLAPGEAEAECAYLQREGVVDAVLSEDVDTLMFGSGLTFRSWTPEVSKSKTPTHVNLYDAKVTKETSGMDRNGMILVALMSGGDYVPEGIPGCGPKTACEAARAGFGHELCQLSRKDKAGLKAWREKLEHELHTNESKHFKTKHGKLCIPQDFPNPEILGYYTHPVLSTQEKVDKLRKELKWDVDIDFAGLRSFAGDAFDWTKLGGAKKFIRNLAPALLVRELRMRAEALAKHPARNAEAAKKDEAAYLKDIHGKRNHASTDCIAELRISFLPHSLVPIDLSTEDPDEEFNNDSTDDEAPDLEAPGSPTKRRGPSTYDPNQVDKLWIFETYVKAGAPLITKEWEDRAKNARILVEARNANREAKRAEKPKVGMQKGALDRYAVPSSSAPPASSCPVPRATQRVPKASQPPKASQRGPRSSQPTKAAPKSGGIQQFARITKPGASSAAPPKPLQDLQDGVQGHRWLGGGRLEVFRSQSPEKSTAPAETISLISSPAVEKVDAPPSTFDVTLNLPDLAPSAVTKRRRSPLRRSATDTAIYDIPTHHDPFDIPLKDLPDIPSSPCSLPSPSQLMPTTKRRKSVELKNSSQVKLATPKKFKKKAVHEIVNLATSSPARQARLSDYFSPRRRVAEDKRLEDVEDLPLFVPEERGIDEAQGLNLTGSPTPKAKGRARRERVPTPPTTQDDPLAARIPPPSFRIPTPSSLPTHHSTIASIDLSLSPPVAPTEPARRTKSQAPPLQPQLQTITTKVQTKQVYRIRESLPGAFAVEELDMTKDVGVVDAKVRKKGKLFRMSGVGVVDLTGD